MPQTPTSALRNSHTDNTNDNAGSLTAESLEAAMQLMSRTNPLLPRH